jgi:hypothetical protein
MGDFPGENTPKKLKIDYPSPSTDSNGWTSPDIATSTIYQLMALNDIVSIRRSARKRLHTLCYLNTLNRPLRMMDRMVYKTDVFIPLTLSVNTGLDTMDVVWMAIGKDYTSMPTPNEQPPTVRNGLTSNTYNDTNLQTGEDGNYNSFYLEGTMSGSTFDLSTYDGFPSTAEFTIESINHSIKVHIGSTLYHIKDDVVGNLNNTECRLNSTTQEIEFNRSLTGRLIRVQVENNYVPVTPVS